MNGQRHSEWLSAGCKLNLFLHINGRRQDGYHELQTYFQLLDYGDQLRVQSNDTGEIRVDWVAGDEGLHGRPGRSEDDLIYRAVRLLRIEAQKRDLCRHDSACSARITLRKHTPVGGGLGGGSAAAAQVLLELNRQWGLGLSIGELCELGKQLGADVPVFLRGQSAMGHGIGDQLSPRAVINSPTTFLVLVPDRRSLTAALFASPLLKRNTPKQSDQWLLTHWREEGFNAFEPLVLADDPALCALRDGLASRAGFARMSGAGTCLFAPVDSPESGHRIGEELSETHPVLRRFIVSRTKNPVKQQVGRRSCRTAEK